MRRLVNNWLFGQVSQKMTGRLDTDVYANSCNELLNMHVFRQGGITRRPPIANPLEVEGYEVLISGKDSYDNPCAFLMGAGKLAYYDFDEVTSITLPQQWAGISAQEVKSVRYARYYNDFYFVHKNYPIMRVTKLSGFIAECPHLFVNQNIKQKYIGLTITVGVSTDEDVVFTFDSKPYNIHVTTGQSSADIAQTIGSLDIDGWTASVVGNVISFHADDIYDSYREYDGNWEGFGFKKKNAQTPPSSFNWAFVLNDEEQRNGLVYGEDDFHDCYLNQTDPYGQKHYASSIAIIGERMWLLVNSDVPEVYVSRPYRTSQIVYPADSNDTILDFIQFEMVATTNTEMKDTDKLPIKIATDSDGDNLWEGVSNDQRIWIPPASDVIHNNEELDAYRADNEYVLEYDPQNVNVVTKLTCGQRVINYTDVWYKTYDEEPLKKWLKESGGDIYSDHYKIDVSGTKYDAEASDSGAGGLIYHYYPTTDIRPNSKTHYYDSNHDEVLNPESTENLLEREVLFTNLETIPIYEYGKQYVMNGQQLRVTYLYNSMIGTLSADGSVVAGAIPLHIYDTSMGAEMYEETTTIDKVATSSTALEFGLSTGRNDKLKWVALGDYIMIGTESAEWRIPVDINALEGSAKIFSSFGTAVDLTTNINTDLAYIQTGKLLRMFYTDDYGLQTMELSSINPDLLRGEIKAMVSRPSPEPSIEILVDDSVVHLCVDRTNGVQAFSKWTFTDEVKSICTIETESGSVLVGLFSSEFGDYIAMFDETEDTDFRDCGYVYFKTEDTTPAQGKTYYELVDDEFEEKIPVSNPKQEGLYEFGLKNGVIQYLSKMKANPFDSVMEDGSVTIGEYKNVSKIIFRCLDTGRIRTYFNIKDTQITRTPVCCDREGEYVGGLADHAINVNGGSVKDLMITVESVNEEPLTLLAMAYELRLNKNGNV